jgi:hypothetical protein
MAEKGGTNLIMIFTICIILISIGFSGCIEDDVEWNKSHFFWINFRPENLTTDYNLILPIPVHNKNHSKPNPEMISEFDEIKIEYEFEYKIESTPYGVGINISSKSYLNFGFDSKPTGESFNYELRLLNISHPLDKGYYWVYSSINGTIEYVYQVSDEEIQVNYYDLFSDVKKGWQVNEGTVDFN